MGVCEVPRASLPDKPRPAQYTQGQPKSRGSRLGPAFALQEAEPREPESPARCRVSGLEHPVWMPLQGIRVRFGPQTTPSEASPSSATDEVCAELRKLYHLVSVLPSVTRMIRIHVHRVDSVGYYVQGEPTGAAASVACSL